MGTKSRFGVLGAALACVVATLLVGGTLATRPSVPEGDAGADREAPSGPEAPTAALSGSRAPSADDSRLRAHRAGANRDPHPARPEDERPKEPRLVRVTDATGTPIGDAVVRIRLADSGEWLSGRTDSDGRWTAQVPAGSVVVAVRVARDGAFGHEVLSLDEARGLDASRLEDLTAPDEEVLVVRTVDRDGDVQAGTRVLYRRAGAESGWSGLTSDGSGLAVLGPLAVGTRVELKHGIRDRFPNESESRPWQEVVSGAHPVDVVVPRAATLRVRVAGLTAESRTPLQVLDARTGHPIWQARHWGDGVWSAAERIDDRPVEVVVGPTADGRFARVPGVVPTGDVLEVVLSPVPPLEGWVLPSPRTDERIEGTLFAEGRGFRVPAEVAADGRFSFPGLPEEDVVIRGDLRVGAHRWIAGVPHRHAEGVGVAVPVTLHAAPRKVALN